MAGWVREWPLDDDERDERDVRQEDRVVEAGGTDGVAFYPAWNGAAADPLLDVLTGLFERKDAA